MHIEDLRSICLDCKQVTEEIKWGNDLCFMIGGKLFCVLVMESPVKASLKVPDEEYALLIERQGIVPAPYVAKYKWILVAETDVFSKEEWKHYITQSYKLVKSKLPLKVQKQLQGD